ncbi:hypothetical protein G6F43_013870 [Rhizopus delemar]|nr:hypothetical protein G6F43_013870 [Rhizopus delemar]
MKKVFNLTTKKLKRFSHGQFQRMSNSIAASLTDLTKGTGHKCRAITWNDECQKSFDLIKKMISSAPVMMTPDMNKPFRIECDASDFAIGAVLMQEESEGIWKPVAFESKKLSQAERNYPAQERELLSILHALRTWRCFIEVPTVSKQADSQIGKMAK